jgi:ABC-type dipeptide/oligopeptide/nickel transport system permease component
MGDLLILSITNTDYWVLNGLVFLTTITFLVVNLGVDILYGFIDPRIRY